MITFIYVLNPRMFAKVVQVTKHIWLLNPHVLRASLTKKIEKTDVEAS